MATDHLFVRPYTEEDEPQVFSLWLDIFDGNLSRAVLQAVVQRKLAVQRELFLVGLFGERLVATVLAGYDGHRGSLHLVAVAPGHRRQGIGRAMLLAAEAALRRLDCPKVNLQVQATNPGAIAFYQGLGYSVEEEVCMGKPLA